VIKVGIQYQVLRAVMGCAPLEEDGGKGQVHARSDVEVENVGESALGCASVDDHDAARQQVFQDRARLTLHSSPATHPLCPRHADSHTYSAILFLVLCHDLNRLSLSLSLLRFCLPLHLLIPHTLVCPKHPTHIHSCAQDLKSMTGRNSHRLVIQAPVVLDGEARGHWIPLAQHAELVASVLLKSRKLVVDLVDLKRRVCDRLHSATKWENAQHTGKWRCVCASA